MMDNKYFKNEINSRAQQLFSLNGATQVSSAKQASALMETFRREAEDRITARHGAEAQIESKRILADQHRELAVMKEIIDSHLKYTVEQAKLQSIEIEERNKIEEKRYLENTRLTKVATWTSVISLFVALVAIMPQIASAWNFIKKWL